MKSAHTHIKEVAGYMLTERLGSGGMGDVFKAYNPVLNRIAAVKILHQAEMAERFKNEAWIQSSVNHPNIARLYNYTIAAGVPCIVMEFVEGDTLDVLLQKKGKLTNEETEKILFQVADALSHLHQQGILHRDIKPSNFKIQPDGLVKMLDFGIAKNKYTPKLTQLGFVIGTTEYMAPEQFENQVELKSDIWSLAVMGYELLTGYLPFEASNPVALRSKIIKGAYTNPKILIPGISGKLNTLIRKNIHVNPSHRLPAKEIVAMLTGAKPSVVFNKPELPSFKKSSFNNRKWVLYTALFIVAFAIITFAFPTNTSVKQATELTVQPAANEIKMKIEVPGIENVVIIFPDGSRQPVPYEVKGKEGETATFTLHADGYTDKMVKVDFTIHRSSFEYNLDKTNP